MNTRLHKVQILSALGLVCGLFNTTHAAAGEDPAELDEVVVTATRTTATLADAPAAVTVVGAKNIETKNASRLGDALDRVPGLYLRDGALGSSQGTSGTSGMSLRGIDQNKTLILLDGQPLQDGRSGKVNWRIPFVEDIERIEVVPGAFSSLYGSNAIGGVVSVITKQPVKHELTAKVKKGWSDASGEDASVYWREKLNNGFGIVVGYGQQRRDSYVNDFVVRTPVAGAAGTTVTGAQPITTRDGAPAYLVGDKGTTPWDSTNATTKVFYNLNERDKLYTGITYQSIDEGYTRFNTYLRDAAGTPVSGGTLGINGQRVTLAESNFVNNSPLHEAATRYFVGYDGTAGDNHLLKIDLAKIDRAYSFTQSGAASSWSGGTGTLTDTPNSGIDGTVQLSFPLGTRQFWVTGLALHRDYANQRSYVLGDWRDPGTRTSVSGGYNGYSMTSAVFAQDEIRIADALKFFLGGRVDRWETRGDNFKNTAPAGTTAFPARGTSAFSPKLSAVYQATPAATLRASFGKSFRAPTNEDMYTTSTINGLTTQGDPNLQPERGTTWEIGGEMHFTGETKATATYFENELSNLIYLKQVTPLVLSQRINAGKAKIRGIELAATARPTDWLMLDANYSYIDSKMLENSADPLSVGKRLTDSPKNLCGIGMTAQRGAWSGVLGVRYISHVYATARNTDVVEGVPTGYDSYTMTDARVGYAFSANVKGNLAINNLFDKKVYSYFLMPRRNLVAELVFDF
ncbi:TonB-dependent receptor [Sideroxydans lithotrophicus]|uniref:TonB-dependent receptor n=1 Tax=Sideroxydans lithotrophicus (strain ES-1) TaxID=580332 RepID=D5CQY2_SIDLE|nr:TonB-dependent receptor [Sideroxydans lithotrophicus]ADE11368.1 TonB-dependent receptor [Sideroxydans lithotrophicus ES-1]